jgi:archaellum component FlaC
MVLEEEKHLMGERMVDEDKFSRMEQIAHEHKDAIDFYQTEKNNTELKLHGVTHRLEESDKTLQRITTNYEVLKEHEINLIKKYEHKKVQDIEDLKERV